MTDSAPPRRILRLGGKDRIGFLQGLVSNDLKRLDKGLVYAALLTPQGKYLADFFLVPETDAVLIDVAAPLADDLIRRLSMYRLRAEVTLADTAIRVSRGLGPAPDGCHADPRHPSLGWRCYDGSTNDVQVDWDAIRVAACIPEATLELIPNETYILEAGFERLSGVDFRKGCYVGQEVTARMKHKTELKKGLVRVRVEGTAPVGTPILTAEGREAGTLFTQSGSHGIAQMRLDRMGEGLVAGVASVFPAEN